MTITLSELKRTLGDLSAADLECIADWLETRVEDARYRTHHVRGAQSQCTPEEPIFMTWEEYLAFEEQSPYRHEYVNGAVYAMSYESLAHNRIAQALISQLLPHLRGSPYQPYFLQAKVEIRAGGDELMYYPDAVIACQLQDLQSQVVRNPTLVVEILSKSTYHIDRREKALNYQRAETVEEYVLIEPSHPRIIVYRRAEGWRPKLYAGTTTSLDLRSIQLSIPLEQIYATELPVQSS